MTICVILRYDALTMKTDENPWWKLGDKAPFVLGIDRSDIERYNTSVRTPDAKVVTESIPEPFIGNPDSARVVLLSLNPGHSEDDQKWHSNPEFQRAMRHNLCHESQEYPFYPMNPEFASSGAAKWWGPRTRELREASGLDPRAFSERLLVIEWFPYHSKKSALRTKRICESQQYSFDRAKKMLDKKLVVRMRSRKHWAEVDPRFGRIPSLKNPQCGYISSGNCEGDLFEQIVKAMQGDG